MKKAVVVIGALLVFCLSSPVPGFSYEKEIQDVAASLSENLKAVGKKQIAVVDFTDLSGNVTELGRFLAEELSVALANAGKGFEVVDRTNLKSIIAENKLSSTGLIDPETARKLGKIAGVDALVTGTLTPFGESVRLAVKILDSSSAKVIGASTVNIAKTKAVEELLGRGIETGGGSVAARTPNNSSSTSVSAPVQNDGISFSLKECKWEKNDLVCTFLVVNEKENQVQLAFRFGDKRSRFIDENGITYYTLKSQFGKRFFSDATEVRDNFPTNVPMRISIFFPGVDSTAKNGNLQILYYEDWHEKNVLLKNISIPEKKQAR